MIFQLKWNWKMLRTQKWGKPIKVLKCETNCLAACSFKWKKWGRVTMSSYKVNTLKANINLSFDLQTLLSLLNPLRASVAVIIGTSQLICSATNNWFTQLTMATLVLNGLKYRSSDPEVFSEKDVLKICSTFTEEHPCRSAISIKLLCKLKSHFGKNVPL